MNAWDQALFVWLTASPQASLELVTLAHVLAVWSPALLALGAAFAWLCGDDARRRDIAAVLLAFVLALAAAWAIRQAWPQPRPFALQLGAQLLEHGASAGFPSSHATGCFALAFACLLQPRLRRVGRWLLALAIAVGWSRVYLGVHFPFDVLGAALTGALAAWAVHASLRGRRLLPSGAAA